MALWGNDDLVSAGAAGASTGATITNTTDLALGASATTPGEIKVGHWIRITTGTDTYQWAQIKTKTDNTTLTLDRPLTNNADKAFQVFSAPQYLQRGWPGKGGTPTPTAATALGANNGLTWVYGVDNTEVAVGNKAAADKGMKHAGWVVRYDRGDGRTPRYRYETVVAMGSMTNAAGDFEDEVFADS